MKFSEECVGLCEEMGLQPISELFTTDGGWAKCVMYAWDVSCPVGCWKKKAASVSDKVNVIS